MEKGGGGVDKRIGKFKEHLHANHKQPYVTELRRFVST